MTYRDHVYDVLFYGIHTINKVPLFMAFQFDLVVAWKKDNVTFPIVFLFGSL